MSTASSPNPARLQVACLCAEWCGTCNQYRPLFAALQTEMPHIAFRWLDIEDESELVDPIEVDNFPTLLISANGRARFFGTVTPHLETLRRLVESHASAEAAELGHAEVQALAARLAEGQG